MPVNSSIIQNTPSGTQEINFFNPLEFENIIFSPSGITYSSEGITVLSKNDFNTFYQQKLQLYNSLLSNFPILSSSFNNEIPVSSFRIFSSSGPNILQYMQTSTASPISLVYNLTFDRVAKTVTFAARANPIQISYQEYLMGFRWITEFNTQVFIG